MHGKALILGAAVLATGAGASSAQQEQEFKNLQVLPADIPRAELKATMEGFADQLDVKCTYCHMPDEYELDDKSHKRTARKMIQLVMFMRENTEQYFKVDTDPEHINCWACHRGMGTPEEYVPAE